MFPTPSQHSWAVYRHLVIKYAFFRGGYSKLRLPSEQFCVSNSLSYFERNNNGADMRWHPALFPNTTTMLKSKKAVLSTPEPLEVIMMSMTEHDLFKAKAVCRHFREVVRESARLRQKLFLAATFRCLESRQTRLSHQSYDLPRRSRSFVLTTLSISPPQSRLSSKFHRSTVHSANQVRSGLRYVLDAATGEGGHGWVST